MNGKVAIALLASLLAINEVQGSTTCKLLDGDPLIILKTVPEIFTTEGDALADKETKKSTVGNAISAVLPTTKVEWNEATHGVFEKFLKEPACIKAQLSDRELWKQAYPSSKNAIIKYLVKKNQLGLLDLSNLTDYACSKVVELAIDGVSSSALHPFTDAHYKALRAGCWTGTKDHAANWSHTLIKHIPAEFFGDRRVKDLVAQEIPDGTGSGKKPVYSVMTAPQLQAFVANPENCDVLTEKVLASNPEHAAHLTAACIRHSEYVTPKTTAATVSKIHEENIGKFVKKLTLEAVGGLSEFNENLVQYLTDKQLGALDSANPLPSLRCAKIRIAKAADAAFKGIDSTCLAGHLNNNDPVVLDATKYANLKDDALKDLNVYNVDRVEKNIVGKWDQLKHLKKSAYWSKLLAGPPELCGKLIMPTGLDKEIAAIADKMPEISRACFMAMKHEVQAYFLSTEKLAKKLAKDALAMMTKTAFDAAWFEHLSKNNAELFKELSSRVPVGPLNACSHLDAKKPLPKGFIENASGPCVRSLQNISAIASPDTSAKDLGNVPKGLLVALPLETLLALKNLPSNFFTTLKRSEFIVLTSSTGNCRRFDAPLLGRMPVDNFSSLSPECFLELTVDLTPEQYAKLDAQTVFAAVTKDTFPRVRTPHLMSGPQIAAISTKVQPKDHAAQAFTAATIKAWGAAKVGSLTEQSMALMPEAAYEAFAPDLFKALDPKALVGISCAKASKFPADSLPHITAAQVPLLGKSIAKREDSARCVYTPEVIAAVLDDEARKLFSGSTMLVASLALVGLCILFGMWLV